jgi:hypothetical protein
MIRVEPELVEKIDAWLAQQRVPPSRSAAIVYMLDEFLRHDLRESRDDRDTLSRLRMRPPGMGATASRHP